ncbi:hypothetical protein HMPREF0873_00360 [Veillonella sp. 3_1_44]|uniref:hypothetical protein n=1 Tax=Veillonella sp. 3_1_44 TaxID=457416 RepID=UPI0001D0BE25|nr:hypothetical protein [Veillonella sp. 3_1_44]EFG23719.1 hypothetical protein HMPREF0873_00360 [Veillonella sp. 3_1_44]
MIFRFQLVENLLEKDYRMSKKYLYYILTFIVSISILGIFSYSFRYQWFINSIVNQNHKLGLNRNIKGFAAEYPYIYTYGDYGILIINTLPNGSVKILPNYNGFTYIDGAYSIDDSSIQRLKNVYGDRLRIYSSIDDFTEDEQLIINEITNMQPKRFDKNDWLYKSI